MIEIIKKKLLENPDCIDKILSNYGYCKIKHHSNYISFARDEKGSPKSIAIWTRDNDNLMVKDYVNGTTCDLFNFIIRQRHTTFKEVINYSKSVLGISNDYFYNRNRAVFGGFYTNIKKNTCCLQKSLSEDILKQYKHCSNRMFIRDNIGIRTQVKFGIGYSELDDCIIIPIRNELGDLIGIKSRINRKPKEDEQKYYYLYPCQMSKTLYNYSENYENLESASVIYIFESEKSVLQCYGYGIKNCVAIGSGTISDYQCKLLLSLNCDRFIFMHDTGYPLESIQNNINKLKLYSRMRETEIAFWDYTKGDYEDKVSPSDLGKKELKRIIKEEIEWVC